MDRPSPSLFTLHSANLVPTASSRLPPKRDAATSRPHDQRLHGPVLQPVTEFQPIHQRQHVCIRTLNSNAVEKHNHYGVFDNRTHPAMLSVSFGRTMRTREHLMLWLAVGAFVACAGAPMSIAAAQSREAPTPAVAAQNKAVVRRWIEDGFNKKVMTVVDALFAESVIINGSAVPRAGVKQNMSRHITAFPDLRVTIEEIVAEGNNVGIWYVVEATQKGEFEGIPATGKQVKWSGCDLLRLENGRIVEARFLSDSLGLMRQLGATLSLPPAQR